MKWKKLKGGNGFIQELDYNEINDCDGRLVYEKYNRGIFFDLILPAILVLGMTMGILEWAFHIFSSLRP